jgi:hypothetical protein
MNEMPNQITGSQRRLAVLSFDRDMKIRHHH